MTTEESIYKSIEKAIVKHQLAPGTRLQEVKLSKIYNVKRGLIRKVLTRLSHTKLVQIKTNIGAQVASPTLKEGHDLFATRHILEKAVIQQLCHHTNEKHIAFLEQYVETEELKYQQGLFDEAKQLSANFHLELAKLTENQVLIEFINNILNRTPLVMLKYAHKHPDKSCINDEHKRIVEAIKNKDEPLAMQLMEHHIEHISLSFKEQQHQPSDNLSEVLNA